MNTAAECWYYNIYRRCVTGANEYRYYHKGELTGSAAALVTPRYPVIINSGEETLYYEHDLEMTFFSGCSRSVYSENQECVKIVYLGFGRHCFENGSDIIRIVSCEDRLCFYQNDLLIAVLYTISNTPNTSDSWELRQVLCVLEEIPHKHLLLMLNFPLLQIGI